MKGLRPIALMGLIHVIAAGMTRLPGSLMNKAHDTLRRRTQRVSVAERARRIGSTPNKYKPHQGKQECARRRDQLMWGRTYNHACSAICTA